MRPCFCCNNFSNNSVLNLDLQIVNDIPLSNKIDVYFCDKCNFYFSVSNSKQDDYNLYYSIFNNYKNYNNCFDKDERCFTPLKFYNGTSKGVPLEIQGQQLPINELNGMPLKRACLISNLHRCKI